jgi:hypothetical protein
MAGKRTFASLPEAVRRIDRIGVGGSGSGQEAQEKPLHLSQWVASRRAQVNARQARRRSHFKSVFLILPEVVLGSSWQNTTSAGTMKSSRWALQWA